MEITEESWKAIIAGQVSDARRIGSLSKQVEKLNWMVEYLANGDDSMIEEAELDWEQEELYRDSLVERRE